MHEDGRGLTERCAYILEDFVCPAEDFSTWGRFGWPAKICVPDAGWHIGDCRLLLPPEGVVITFADKGGQDAGALVYVQMGRRLEFVGGQARFVGPSTSITSPTGGVPIGRQRGEASVFSYAAKKRTQTVASTRGGTWGRALSYELSSRSAVIGSQEMGPPTGQDEERAEDIMEDNVVWMQHNWSSGCVRGIAAQSADVVIADSANVSFERLCSSSDEAADVLGQMGGGAVLARTLEVHGSAFFSENHVFGQGGGGAVAAQLVNITGEARFEECSAAADGGAVYITDFPDLKAWDPLQREDGLRYSWEFSPQWEFAGAAAARKNTVVAQLGNRFEFFSMSDGLQHQVEGQYHPDLTGLVPFVKLAWSPNGDFLAAGGQDGLYIFTNTLLLFAKIKVPVKTLVWRPDSKSIAGGDLCELWVADLLHKGTKSSDAGVAVRRAHAVICPAFCAADANSEGRWCSLTLSWRVDGKHHPGFVTVTNKVAEFWVDTGKELRLLDLSKRVTSGAGDADDSTKGLRMFWTALLDNLYMTISTVAFSSNGQWLAVVLDDQKQVVLYGWDESKKTYSDMLRACWLPDSMYSGSAGLPDLLLWHPTDDIVLLGCTGCNFFWTLKVTMGSVERDTFNAAGRDVCFKDEHYLVDTGRTVTEMSWSVPSGDHIVVSTQCKLVSCTGTPQMLMLFNGVRQPRAPNRRVPGFFVRGPASFTRTRTLQRGGAVAVTNGVLALERTTFNHAWAAESGGAVFTEFQVEVFLKHVDFKEHNSCVLGPNHAELRVSIDQPMPKDRGVALNMHHVSLAPMGSLKVRVFRPGDAFDISHITGVVCPFGHRRESDHWLIPNSEGKVELIMLRLRCLPCKEKRAYSPESDLCEPCPVGLKCDSPGSDFRVPELGSFVEMMRVDDAYCQNRTLGGMLPQESPRGVPSERHFYWYNDSDNTKVCHKTICLLPAQELKGDACRSCTELYGEGFTSNRGESCWRKPVKFIHGPTVHRVRHTHAEIWMKTSVVASVQCQAWPVKRCGPWRWFLSEVATVSQTGTAGVDNTGVVHTATCGGLSNTGESIRTFQQLSHSTVYTCFCELIAYEKWRNQSSHFTFETPFSLTSWSAEEPLIFAIIGAVGALGCMLAAHFVHGKLFRMVLAAGSGAILLAVNMLGFIAAVKEPKGSWDSFGIRLAEALAAGVVACISQLRHARKAQHEFDEWQIKEALQIAVEVRYPVVLMRADHLIRCGKLPTHEEARSKRLLSFFGAASEVTDFFGSESSRSFAVFFSHQWTSFASPDPTGKQYEVICTALKELCSTTHRRADEIYTWVDIFSIPQACRRTKLLAIQSLPVYASLANAFVIVSPRVVHEDTEAFCDRHSYQRRGWCRIEQLSHRARRGARHMFLADDFGLQSLDRTAETSMSSDAVQRHRTSTLAELHSWFDENLYPFSGRAEFTCCRMKHVINGAPVPCDREALMLPMLGLYAEIYRRRSEPQLAGLHAAIAANLETVFPANFVYVTPQGDLMRDLFKGLVARLQKHLDTEALHLVKGTRAMTADRKSTFDENGWPRSSLCLDLSSVDLYDSSAGCPSPRGAAVWMGSPSVHRAKSRLRAGADDQEDFQQDAAEGRDSRSVLGLAAYAFAAVGGGGGGGAESGTHGARRMTKRRSLRQAGNLPAPGERMTTINSFPPCSSTSCSDQDGGHLSTTEAGPPGGSSSSFVAPSSATGGQGADESPSDTDPESAISAASALQLRRGGHRRSGHGSDSRDGTLELVRVEITARQGAAISLPGPGRRDQS